MRAAVALALLAAAPGCYRMTVKTGAPKGEISLEADDKIYTGLFVGAVPLADPDLEAACPGGVAEIEQEMALADGVINLVLSYMLTLQRVTIRCAAPAGG